MNELWGRERECELLHGLVADVARGRGAVARIEGEPGIGKTRLLAEATARAREAGCRVSEAGTDEILAGRPFALLTEAFGIRPAAPDAEVAAIAAMLAPTYRGRPELEYVIVDRIVDLVERLAAHEPLVLACDDLQWADPSSIRVLYRISELTAGVPLLLLVGRRPAPCSNELDRLIRGMDASMATHLPLRPLSGDAARAFAASLRGSALTEPEKHQVDRALGNPLLVEGVVDLLSDPGAAASSPIGAGVPDSSPGRVPDGNPDTGGDPILTRISWLDDATLEVLRAAAVLGSPFRLADLALVTGHGVPALLRLLREPVTLGVLRPQQDAYAFRHDLVREAIYRGMAGPEAAARHVHTGHALAEAGRDPLEVANHLGRGAPPGDPAALDWLARAAATVKPHAPGTAADLLDQAVGLTVPSSPRRLELRLTQLTARLTAGPLPEAVQLGERLLAENPPGATLPVRRVLAEARMWQGRWAGAASELAVLLAADDPELTDAQRIRLRAWQAYLEAWHDPDAADPLIDRALTESRQHPDISADSDAPADPAALATLADAIRHLFRGYFAHAADQAETAADALVARFDQGEAVALVPPVICQFAARRFDEVRRLLTHPLWAERSRHQSQRHAMLAGMHYLSGEWDDALAVTDTLTVLAREQDRERDRQIVPWVRCLVALGRGELAQMTSELEAADPIPEFRCLAGQLAHAEGRLEEVRKIVTEIREPVLDAPDHRLTLRPLWPAYLPLCLAVDEREIAEEIVEVVTEIGDRAGTTATSAEAWHARGLLDGDPEPLLAAAEAYQETPLAVERAACQEAAGLALTERGHTDDAARRLQAAAAGYESMGADRHLARVEAALRRVGVIRGRRGPRQRTQTGWESLTPTEQAVADLVGDGLIYREIAERLYIARHTVETHVTHVFAKLGIRSRTDCAHSCGSVQPSRPAPLRGPAYVLAGHSGRPQSSFRIYQCASQGCRVVPVEHTVDLFQGRGVDERDHRPNLVVAIAVDDDLYGNQTLIAAKRAAAPRTERRLVQRVRTHTLVAP